MFLKTFLDMLKASENAKCVGCGFCCLSATCAHGRENEKGECTFLSWDGERYRCSSRPAMSEMAGTGCCCGFMNTWRDDVQFHGYKK